MMNSRMKLVFAVLVLLVGLCWGRPWMGLFGSRDCTECTEIKELWEDMDMDDENVPVIVYLCVDDPVNYNYLKSVEQALNVKRASYAFPVMLIGRNMVAGLDGFLEVDPETRGDWLERIPKDDILAPMWEAAQNAVSPVVEINAADFFDSLVVEDEEAVEFKSESPELLYIFQTGCQHCSRQMKELKMLAEKVPGFKLACYNIADEDGQIMRRRIVDALGLNQEESLALNPPLLSWDDGYVVGSLATVEDLLPVLAEQEPIEHFWNKPIDEQERIAMKSIMDDVVGSATIGVVALAGLIDGINPCAFATSIFLIGYLLYLKRKSSQIVLVGSFFCMGVFVTYILFGLGLSYIINWLNRYAWIKVGIYGVFAAVTIVLAVMSIRDAFTFRRTKKASDMDLGLSKETHHKMHERIKKVMFLNSWMIAPAALLLGFVISSMELACTGQIYLPTIAAINSNALSWRAFWLLILYNVAFIVPLVGVTMLAAFGCGAKKLSGWALKHVFSTKVLMGVIFGLLGLLMVWFAVTAAPKNLPESSSVNCLVDETVFD